MEIDCEDSQIMASPNLVTLSPFKPMKSPNSRRLSSHFVKPHCLLAVQPAPRRPLAWISLQGRLVGAEEASSAKAVGVSGLSAGEVLAWKLFSPIHRILIVAVVAVAAANSEKNRQIHRLQKSVKLRDEVLSSMQDKLDILCEQVNVMKDQAEPATALAVNNCWLCVQHRVQLCYLKGNADSKAPEMFKCRMSLPTDAEPEERRMSDLSDWASSVTSSLDIQVSDMLENLAIEQDVYNLKSDCEEKDFTIKELSEFIISKDAASLKRVQELDDIIQQKTMIITKLRKDVSILEQKVVQLTRLKRRSFSGQVMQVVQSLEMPAMRDNLLYDMDSTTSPSSSDSDCSSSNKKTCSVKTTEKEAPAPPAISNQTRLTTLPTSSRIQHSAPAKMCSVVPSIQHNTRPGPATPLQEKSMNQSSTMIPCSSKKKIFKTGGDSKNRRRELTGLKGGALQSQKRWF